MNPLENLPPFYPGQKVVYIGPRNARGFESNKIYTVVECAKLCICNTWDVDVGIPVRTGYKGTMCYTCGKTDLRKTQILLAEYFKPVQQQKFPLIKLERVTEKELCAN